MSAFSRRGLLKAIVALPALVVAGRVADKSEDRYQPSPTSGVDLVTSGYSQVVTTYGPQMTVTTATVSTTVSFVDAMRGVWLPPGYDLRG